MNSAYSIFKTFILSLLIIGQVNLANAQSATTASILPPAKTTFLDQNGKPLTGGTVAFSIPGTTTAKTTWQDAAETIPNANPVVLDSAGRAIILGSGSYRQQLFDRFHNLIWDQVTATAGSGSTGPTATGDGDLVGTIKPWAGIAAPNQYMFAAGQQLSRSLFPSLFTAITSVQTATCTSGNQTITGLTDTTQFWIGMSVEVNCLASGSSTITAKTAASVTLAGTPNTSVNTPATFFPWGNGNATTTFTLPDLRGFVIAGNNNMGGTANTVLTTQFFGAATPNSSGAAGGSQSEVLAAGEIPTITGTSSNGVSLSVASTVSNIIEGSVASANTGSGAGITTLSGASSVQVTSTGSINAGSISFSSTNTGGSTPAAISLVQPTKTSNYIIKVTPDSNSATANGVTSLGLMTGDIGCGANVLCTGNVISVPSIVAPCLLNVPIVGTGATTTPACDTNGPLGSAAFINTGTSGSTLGLLNTANAYSAAQTFSAGMTINGTITGTYTLAGTPTYTNLPVATTSVQGIMKGDGTTINCSVGVCTATGSSATTITPGTTTVTGGATFGILGTNGTALINAIPASVQANIIGTPATTTSSAGIMMGFGATCHITPAFSGRVKFEIIGTLFNGTAGDLTQSRLFFGTGTAPANGVAVTGTQLGNISEANAPVTNGSSPATLAGIATGLAIGTAEWFDIALNIGTGSAGIQSISCNAFEF